MVSFNKVSKDFNSLLIDAAKNKTIDKTELADLQKAVKTPEDKAVIDLISKDGTHVEFKVKQGISQSNFELDIDLDELPKSENQEQELVNSGISKESSKQFSDIFKDNNIPPEQAKEIIDFLKKENVNILSPGVINDLIKVAGNDTYINGNDKLIAMKTYVTVLDAVQNNKFLNEQNTGLYKNQALKNILEGNFFILSTPLESGTLGAYSDGKDYFKIDKIDLNNKDSRTVVIHEMKHMLQDVSEKKWSRFGTEEDAHGTGAEYNLIESGFIKKKVDNLELNVKKVFDFYKNTSTDPTAASVYKSLNNDIRLDALASDRKILGDLIFGNNSKLSNSSEIKVLLMAARFERGFPDVVKNHVSENFDSLKGKYKLSDLSKEDATQLQNFARNNGIKDEDLGPLIYLSKHNETLAITDITENGGDLFGQIKAEFDFDNGKSFKENYGSHPYAKFSSDPDKYDKKDGLKSVNHEAIHAFSGLFATNKISKDDLAALKNIAVYNMVKIEDLTTLILNAPKLGVSVSELKVFLEKTESGNVPLKALINNINDSFDDPSKIAVIKKAINDKASDILEDKVLTYLALKNNIPESDLRKLEAISAKEGISSKEFLNFLVNLSDSGLNGKNAFETILKKVDDRNNFSVPGLIKYFNSEFSDSKDPDTLKKLKDVFDSPDTKSLAVFNDLLLGNVFARRKIFTMPEIEEYKALAKNNGKTFADLVSLLFNNKIVNQDELKSELLKK